MGLKLLELPTFQETFCHLKPIAALPFKAEQMVWMYYMDHQDPKVSPGYFLRLSVLSDKLANPPAMSFKNFAND